MKFDPGKGWTKESEDLFIHDSGARIANTTYRGNPGWWAFPVDLDAPPVQHPATDEGREEAFATFAKGLPKPKPKPKPKEDVKKKKAAHHDDDDEPRPPSDEEPGPDAPPAEPADAADEDEDEDDEKEEKEEKDADD